MDLGSGGRLEPCLTDTPVYNGDFKAGPNRSCMHSCGSLMGGTKLHSQPLPRSVSTEILCQKVHILKSVHEGNGKSDYSTR